MRKISRLIVFAAALVLGVAGGTYAAQNVVGVVADGVFAPAGAPAGDGANGASAGSMEAAANRVIAVPLEQCTSAPPTYDVYRARNSNNCVEEAVVGDIVISSPCECDGSEYVR